MQTLLGLMGAAHGVDAYAGAILPATRGLYLVAPAAAEALVGLAGAGAVIHTFNQWNEWRDNTAASLFNTVSEKFGMGLHVPTRAEAIVAAGKWSDYTITPVRDMTADGTDAPAEQCQPTQPHYDFDRVREAAAGAAKDLRGKGQSAHFEAELVKPSYYADARVQVSLTAHPRTDLYTESYGVGDTIKVTASFIDPGHPDVMCTSGPVTLHCEIVRSSGMTDVHTLSATNKDLESADTWVELIRNHENYYRP